MNQLTPELKADSEPNYTLLTGATGLVGQYLMRDLLLQGKSLAVAVRPTKKLSAQQRIDQILDYWQQQTDHQIPKPVVLTCDISEPNFGFDSEQKRWLADHCDTIIHNAAILRFTGADPDGEPWRTNLNGTVNAIKFSESCDINNMHYISTAYVCGSRNGTIQEDDFGDQAGFRNDYEKSKFQAEQKIRQANCFDSTTIYRPVVISGDSKTGFTSTYHGLYVYLRLFAMFIPEQTRGADGKILTPVKIPMEGNEPRNVVPVDWVSDVFCALFNNPAAHGRTYHLAPSQCLTPSEVIDACYDYFESHGVEFCGDDLPSDFKQPEYAEKIFDNIAIYQQYESNDPHFDTSNLARYAGDTPCPPIDKQMLHRYLDFGNKDNWGKRRPLKIANTDETDKTNERTA